MCHRTLPPLGRQLGLLFCFHDARVEAGSDEQSASYLGQPQVCAPLVQIEAAEMHLGWSNGTL